MKPRGGQGRIGEVEGILGQRNYSAYDVHLPYVVKIHRTEQHALWTLMAAMDLS